MFLFLSRILKLSLQDIFRNIWLSIVTVTILILALFSINSLITVQLISQNAIEAIKERVDINLYLDNEASESDILGLKEEIESMDQTKSVQYISKQEALSAFREKNSDNPEIVQSLRELGKNPLSPSLIIVPSSSEKASELINILKGYESNIIESRDFTDNAIILEKVNNITDKINQIGMIVILIFIIISLLVVYNSIRVAIYTHRKEINIMRLVGASNSFIYLPFVVSSIIYSILSMGFIIAIFYPFISLLQPYLEVFFVGYDINVVNYFFGNFWQIFGVQFLLVLIVNVLASLVAVRKYARV
jgi:cell division transport system permease protein